MDALHDDSDDAPTRPRVINELPSPTAKIRPQNFDSGKKLRGHYTCPSGCAQKIPEEQRIVHQQHCPVAAHAYLNHRRANREDEALGRLAKEEKEKRKNERAHAELLKNDGKAKRGSAEWDQVKKTPKRKQKPQNLKILEGCPKFDTVAKFLEDVKLAREQHPKSE